MTITDTTVLESFILRTFLSASLSVSPSGFLTHLISVSLPLVVTHARPSLADLLALFRGEPLAPAHGPAARAGDHHFRGTARAGSPGRRGPLWTGPTARAAGTTGTNRREFLFLAIPGNPDLGRPDGHDLGIGHTITDLVPFVADQRLIAQNAEHIRDRVLLRGRQNEEVLLLELLRRGFGLRQQLAQVAAPGAVRVRLDRNHLRLR